MLMMARDRDYVELRESLKGKRVLIWTCNTCSRLCNGIGGTESAGRLSEALKADGVDVIGLMYTSASCLEDKIRAKYDSSMIGRSDVILSLTCDVGSRCVERVFGKKSINPIITFGPGYASEDGSLFISRIEDGSEISKEISELVAESGHESGPFV